MKLVKRMEQKRLGNKGFSLVELIIVIAIMAILIGIVGTQVVPYLRRAREEKDMQIIDAFSTAAVTFYSLNTDQFAQLEAPNAGIQYAKYIISDGSVVRVQPGSDFGMDDNTWIQGFEELTGYSSINDVKAAMSSAEGKKIGSIVVFYNFSGSDFTWTPVSTLPGAVTVYACSDEAGDNPILETAVSYIGMPQN